MMNQDRYRRESRWDVPDEWRGDDTRGWAMPQGSAGYDSGFREEVYQGHPSRQTGYQPRSEGGSFATQGYRGDADADRYATPAVPGRQRGTYDNQREAGRPWYGDGGTSEREWWGAAPRQEGGDSGWGYRDPRTRAGAGQGSGPSMGSGAIYGPHSGRGPKGYRRSDDRICEDVCEALTQHGDIDASEVEVRVEQGDVILSGTVDDRRQKRLAEDIAERCAGVMDVRNEIRVSGSAHRTGTATGTATTYSGAASRAASGPGEPVATGNGQRGTKGQRTEGSGSD